jgi:hypothetical protein
MSDELRIPDASPEVLAELADELERPGPATLMTAPEAARYLGVSWLTLKAWPIPYLQVGARGRRRYSRADLDAFVAESRRVPS